MNVVRTDIPEVLILEPRVFEDPRGLFFESFNEQRFAEATGLSPSFVQDNHSSSTKGTLRGLHFQLPPHAQSKLVRVAVGEIFDVAVDARRSSPTFGRWVGARLSAENRRQMWVPRGFAHGFVVVSDVAEVLYKTDAYYAQSAERCLAWDEPTVGIDWPLDGAAPILSPKDAQGASLEDLDAFD